MIIRIYFLEVRSMRFVDLRSDTKTLPTSEMREAIFNAELGDDCAGEDQTVNNLEELAAKVLGKEAAVLVSSGTQGNLTALLSHCDRGDEVLLGRQSHIFRAEAMGASVLGGIALMPLNDDEGYISLEEIEQSIRVNDSRYPNTKLLALENTHNGSGGTPLSKAYLDDCSDIAHLKGISVHIDGARLFNASVALNIKPSELVNSIDTVTFCLSKGLASPVGSLLVGDKDFINKARRWRKMLGSAMRQSGIIAAAGIVSINMMIERLKEDHLNAKKLANGLNNIPGISIEVEKFQTNMVFCSVDNGKGEWLTETLSDKGILVGHVGNSVLRLVTHNDISSDDIDYTIKSIQQILLDK